MTTRPHALLVMGEDSFAQQFGPSELERLAALAVLGDPVRVGSFDEVDAARLARTEALITSWGAPAITPELLAAMPSLRAVLHAAGSVRHLLPQPILDEVFDRGIAVSSAADANAGPVAEYTLAAVILAGKRALPLAQATRTTPLSWGDAFGANRLSNYRRTIGIIGFSKIGRRVIELLRVLETGPVLVSDPYADPVEVLAAGAELVTLEETLRRSEILSLHAPLLPSTEHMIGAAELALLPDGATVINTARGGIVDHDALLHECASGRLDAILDVTEPEPLPAGHPLLALPNVTVTPHVAGSLGSETRRLSRHAIDALAAVVAGEPVPGAVQRETNEVSA